MATFTIQPLSRFEGVNTAIKRPMEIAYYSVDKQRNVTPFSNEELRYYYPPFFHLPSGEPGRKERATLKHGIDTFIKRDESVDEHLDGLLDTLMEYEKRTGEVCVADFIAFRGQMTKIMTAPFDRYAAFEMNATCYQGSIYIEENHVHKHSNTYNRNSKQSPARTPGDAFQYWGYKFESLSTLPCPWQECTREQIENRDSEPVDNIAEYCSIVHTGIGSNLLIIAGEVDCVQGEKPGDATKEPVPWIELKTSKMVENDRDVINLENKMCRFWAQSFLLGVPKIIIGWRDDHGSLLGLEEIPTQKIPSKVKREGRGSWDGNVCINFAAAVLDFLKQTVTDDGVWRIAFRKGERGITVTKIEDSGTGQIIKEDFKIHRAGIISEQAERKKQAAQDVLAMLGKK